MWNLLSTLLETKLINLMVKYTLVWLSQLSSLFKEDTERLKELKYWKSKLWIGYNQIFSLCLHELITIKMKTIKEMNRMIVKGMKDFLQILCQAIINQTEEE